MKRLAGLVAVVALMSACSGAPDITQGRIASKDHHDSYTYITMICAGYNKGVCSVYVPITNHVPESWSLHIVNGDKDADLDVAETTYDKYHVGDWFDSKVVQS